MIQKGEQEHACLDVWDFPFETNQNTQNIRAHKWRVRYASSLKNLPIWSVRVP